MKNFIIATVVAVAALGTVANAASDYGFNFNAGIQTGSETGLVFGATMSGIGSGTTFATFGASRAKTTNATSSTVDGHAITLGYEFAGGYTVGYRMDRENGSNADHSKTNSIMVGLNHTFTGSKNTFGCATNLYTTHKTAGGVNKTNDSFDMGLCTLSHSFG